MRVLPWARSQAHRQQSRPALKAAPAAAPAMRHPCDVCRGGQPLRPAARDSRGPPAPTFRVRRRRCRAALPTIALLARLQLASAPPRTNPRLVGPTAACAPCRTPGPARARRGKGWQPRACARAFIGEQRHRLGNHLDHTVACAHYRLSSMLQALSQGRKPSGAARMPGSLWRPSAAHSPPSTCALQAGGRGARCGRGWRRARGSGPAHCVSNQLGERRAAARAVSPLQRCGTKRISACGGRCATSRRRADGGAAHLPAGGVVWCCIVFSCGRCQSTRCWLEFLPLYVMKS